ncbi:MAG: M23 family metallopeptidase, partial [Synechococcus sp.]
MKLGIDRAFTATISLPIAASCAMAAAIQFGLPASAESRQRERVCVQLPAGVYDLVGRPFNRNGYYCFEDELDRSYFLLEYFLSESGLPPEETLGILGEIQAVEGEIREFIDANSMSETINEYIQHYQASTLIKLADDYLFPEGFDPTGALQEVIPVDIEQIEPLVDAALDGSLEDIGFDLLEAAAPTMTAQIDGAVAQYLGGQLGEVVDADFMVGLTETIAPVIQGDIDGLLTSGILGDRFDQLLNERLSAQLSGVLGDSVAGELSSTLSVLLQGGDIQQTLVANASSLVRDRIEEVVFDAIQTSLGNQIGTVLDNSVLSGLDGALNEALGLGLTDLLSGSLSLSAGSIRDAAVSTVRTIATDALIANTPFGQWSEQIGDLLAERFGLAGIEQAIGVEGLELVAIAYELLTTPGLWAYLDIPLGSAEGVIDYTISGSDVEGWSVPCLELSDCDHIELVSDMWPGVHGRRWVASQQMVEGGHNFPLDLLNGGQEPTGRHLFGDFKLVVRSVDEAAGSASFGIYMRFCVSFFFYESCSPYFIGPLPWFSAREKDFVLIGKGGSAPIDIPAGEGPPPPPNTPVDPQPTPTPEPIPTPSPEPTPSVEECTSPLHPAPGYPVTSSFGYRTHPITGLERLHTGIDLGVPVGVPIRASCSGSVVIANENGGYGLMVTIQHDAS